MEAGLRGLRSSRRIPVIQYNDEDEVKLPKPRERSVAVEEEQPKKETSKQNLSSLMFDFDIKQDNLSDAEFESVKRLYDALKDPKRSKARSIPELMKDIGLTEEEKNLIVSEMRSMPKDETLHVDTTHQGEYDRLEELMRDDSSIMSTLAAWTKEVEKAILGFSHLRNKYGEDALQKQKLRLVIVGGYDPRLSENVDYFRELNELAMVILVSFSEA